MTDSEVLQKAIERAIENGWKTNIFWDDMLSQPTIYDGDGGYAYVNPLSILFDHDFARALFGEEELERATSNDHIKIKGNFTRPVRGHEGWQYHIQQLALAEDRIGYLREYLEGKK